MFTLKKLQELFFVSLTLVLAIVVVRSDEIGVEGVEKRAPGWGKRDSQQNKLGYLNSVLTDLSRYEMSKNGLDNIDLSKRRPGWGKRGAVGVVDDFDLDKRRPGWGKRSSSFEMDGVLQKRAPGWGKRSYDIDEDFDEEDSDSTRSKRRPGWGKRSYLEETVTMTKRRPGWGKRAPGWGKRSGSESRDCSDIINSIRLLNLRLSLVSISFYPFIKEKYLSIYLTLIAKAVHFHLG